MVLNCLMISANQIRAARGLLNWTQAELAKKCGLSLRALNNIERGVATPRVENLRFIRETFEKEDIEFSEHDGLRRRVEKLEMLKLEGAHYVDQHLLDVMHETRSGVTEVLYNILSEADFTEMRPDVMDEFFQHIARHKITERFLIARGETYTISPPSTYRWLRRESFNHVGYIVYGDNVAFHIQKTPHRMIIIRNPGIAAMFRMQFEANWKIAEIPWFAAQYKLEKSEEDWSTAKAAAAREWIAAAKRRSDGAL